MKKLKIVGITVGAVIVIVIIAMIILVISIENKINSPQGDAEVILQGTHSNSKKAIVVFQPSMFGNTNTIAGEIGRGLNESGYEVTINHPGEHLSADLSSYEVIFFGSPIYAGQISSVLKEYMQEVSFSDNSKVILFITGLLEENELYRMDDIPQNDILYAKVKFFANESGFIDAFYYANNIVY